MLSLTSVKKILTLSIALLLSSGLNSNESPTMPSSNKLENTSKPIGYTTPGQTNSDHLYLEEVLGEQALTDVKNWNARTLKRLMADPLFEKMNNEVLDIVNSKDKIPYVSYRGGEVHNFWQDEQHVRGLWRKTTLASYLTESPVWQTVLDIDALAKSENKNWVYKGNNCLSPDYERCLIALSDGGKDATVTREFNTKTRSFVKNGFVTSESKGGMDWIDKDSIIIGIDFGDNTMTDSGYPMVAKIWQRGSPLSSAIEIDRGEKSDVGYWGSALELRDGRREIITTRAISFYDTETFWFSRQANGSTYNKVKFPLPKNQILMANIKDSSS